MVTLLVMAAVAAVAGAAAMAVSRSRRPAPTAVPNEPPTSLDRRDFVAPEAAHLVVVFSSASCASCAAVWSEVSAFGGAGADVAVEEVEVAAAPELHTKYAIDSVPTTVVVDSTGDARVAVVGPIGPADRQALHTVLGLG